MFGRFFFLGLLAIIAAAAQSAVAQAPITRISDPADRPAVIQTNEQFVAEQRNSLKQAIEQNPLTPAKPIESLIRLDIVDGSLVFSDPDTHGVDLMNFALEGDPSTALHLEVSHLATQPPIDSIDMHLMRLDTTAPRALNVGLSRTPDRVNLDITIETPADTTNAQLICQTATLPDAPQTPVVRLYMIRSETVAGADDARISAAEATFAKFVELHHDEAVAMLGEGLTAIRSMHVLSGVGQAEARAIFDASRPIPPSTERELDAIVSVLRERGSAALPELRNHLRTLGAPAAAALARRPREGWSVDLGLNVDTLTADLLPGGAASAAALLNSPSHLIDLLYAPDLAVRRGAKDKLEAALKDKISIDPDTDPYTCVPQIEALRSRVAKIH